MDRQELKRGNTIQLNGRQYTIEKVIGCGATCIVYSAEYEDHLGHTHRVNLKECYPYEADITRDGQRLIWNSQEERIQQTSAFQTAYEKLMACQNGNYSVHAFDLCEANETLYIVMDANEGVTFDKDTGASLCDILKTVRLLTHVVEDYHNSGYLHLDIKPSNFLVYPRPSEHIVLFDMDSVTSISDIQAGKAKAISYSDGWAAPEQKQGRTAALCPATDLYAIGATLFQKVMGRPVDPFDMDTFADWDFEGEIFDNVNPKIKRLLRNIFRKTLAANVKRRYASAAELMVDLDEAIETARDGKPFLISNYPVNTNPFVGREQELTAIAEAFTSGNHLIFLHGIGGIGKSELVKQYAVLHEKEYDAILFCQYAGSVAELLDKIEIQNFDGSDNEHDKHLHRLLDKHILLIVDGLDSDDDPNFGVLESLKCDVLITSRLDWKEYSFPTLEISAMTEADQLALFVAVFEDTMPPHQQQTVLEILKEIEGYTLLIPLIAKQLRKGASNFEGTLSHLRFEGIKAASVGKVRHLKDGMTMSGSIYGILSEVLNMADFSADEAYIMRSLTLLSQYRIDQNAFVGWVGNEYHEQIDDLVFEGWILRERIRGAYTLSLHAVIANLCYEELKPSISNCEGIRDRIWTFAVNFAQWYKNPQAFRGLDGYVPTIVQPHDQYQFDSFSEMMSIILNKSDWKDGENILFWIHVLEKVSNVIYGDCSKFEAFLNYLLNMGALAESESSELPYISKIALAMEAVTLNKSDLDTSLICAQIAIDHLDSCPNPDEIAFRVCLTFYQYICHKTSNEEWYWEEPGFDELANIVNNVWKNIVDNCDIEFEENDVWVLSNGQCDITTDEAIAQAYNDYCWKISSDGIKYATGIFIDENGTFYEDYLAARKLYDSRYTETMITDIGGQLTDEEVFLSKHASDLERQVDALLPCDVMSELGLWIVIKPPVCSADKKKSIYAHLKQIDPFLPYHVPSIDTRSFFVTKLAKMEASFSYAYALVEDWKDFDFHVSNLMNYYKVLIYGRRYGSFKFTGIDDIKTHLPGAASLLNQYGDILPLNRALDILNQIISHMESYCSDEHIGFDRLFEVYEMALDIARKANKNASITHYEKRIKAISSVYFSKKTK